MAIIFKMPNFHIVSILAVAAMGFSEFVEGPQPVLQRTVAALFHSSDDAVYPGGCHVLSTSQRQSKMCRRDPGLAQTIAGARHQAISHCQDSFRFDRWNCSLYLNNKKKRNIFRAVYRETAFVHALIAASITHTVARACATGTMSKCMCAKDKNSHDTRAQWKKEGCDDEVKHGKRITKNFLELPEAGNDHIAEVLKQDINVGISSVTTQMRDVCKCHGFSGSCTLKTCWKRVGNFNSTIALLKRQYHHAVIKKIVNYTSKRAINEVKKRRRKKKLNSLLYLQKSPNLCKSTVGRECHNPDNCATLCCGRGFTTRTVQVEERCNCKWVDCCYVKCEICVVDRDLHTCK